MRPLRADALLAMPVKLNGIQLGRPADLLLDRDELKVLGVDVLCGDEIHRFLPFPVAAVAEPGLVIHSPLVLLEEDELAFYRARAFTLSALRGRRVEQAGCDIGRLQDVVVAADGSLVEVVIEEGGVERTLPFDATVEIAPGSRSAA